VHDGLASREGKLDEQEVGRQRGLQGRRVKSRVLEMGRVKEVETAEDKVYL
jgi:hypothetical protein